jgi:(1->4)-alpha-D-glucan 1-alpha-D-glucosylmutase
MLTTSTHDSKRSEDVRARLSVLSEIPEKWDAMLQRWNRLNRGRKRNVAGVEAPSRNDEVLLYQTLIGSWPLAMPDEAGLIDYRTRIGDYMIKALREGKEHSNWINVNTDYETAMSDFVQAILAQGEKNLFLADFVPLVQPIAHFGLLNSLAQTLIKATSPGVPDIYQGCELWQFNLVDPDNRRPVDFLRRQELLAEIKALVAAPPEQWPQRLLPLLEDMSDGRIKLYILWQSLALRERWPDVFREGDYLPLTVHGGAAAHVCAFARCYADRAFITLVPRLTVGLLSELPLLPMGPEVWGDTTVELPDEIAGCEWTNVFTGEVHTAASSFAVGRLLACFPEALLTAEPG